MRAGIICAVLLTAGGAVAQEGDATLGRALAEEYCAGCHEIGPGGGAKAYPPSFAAIAGFRPREQIIARIFFPPYHASMPRAGDVMLPNEVYHLTAYIQSLEMP